MKAFRELIESPAFSDRDRHFARFLEVQAGGNAPLIALAAALVSRARGEGNICLDLPTTAETSFPKKSSEADEPVLLPALDVWLKALKSSSVVALSTSGRSPSTQ